MTSDFMFHCNYPCVSLTLSLSLSLSLQTKRYINVLQYFYSQFMGFPFQQSKYFCKWRVVSAALATSYADNQDSIISR